MRWECGINKYHWNWMECGSRIACLASFFCFLYHVSRAHTNTTQTMVCMHSISIATMKNRHDREWTNQNEFGRFGTLGDRIIYDRDGVQLPIQQKKNDILFDKFRSTKLCNTNVGNHMRVTSFAISSFFVDKFAKPWAGVPEVIFCFLIKKELCKKNRNESNKNGTCEMNVTR